METHVKFYQMDGFKPIDESDKIVTEDFLNSSREVVCIVDKFGKIFSPVSRDIKGNIEKIHKIYTSNKDKYVYLEDLILMDIQTGKQVITIPLLWLKRALHLIERFLSHILEDESRDEEIKKHMKTAYEITLKPYHGWFIQETFSLIYKVIPKRSQLIGTGDIHDENIRALDKYVPAMRVHIIRINKLYECHNICENGTINKVVS